MEVLALVLPFLQLDSASFSSSSRSRRGKLLSQKMPANEAWCLWKTWETPSQCWSRRGRGGWGTSSFSSTHASRFQSLGNILCWCQHFQLGNLTYTGMDYLYFRRKFTWTDEDSLITWYNHLRWRRVACVWWTQYVFSKVLHRHWWRDCPLRDLALACSFSPASWSEHRYHRRPVSSMKNYHLTHSFHGSFMGLKIHRI